MFKLVRIRNTKYNNRRRSAIMFAKIFKRIIKNYLKSNLTNKIIDLTIM